VSSVFGRPRPRRLVLALCSGSLARCVRREPQSSRSRVNRSALGPRLPRVAIASRAWRIRGRTRAAHTPFFVPDARTASSRVRADRCRGPGGDGRWGWGGRWLAGNGGRLSEINCRGDGRRDAPCLDGGPPTYWGGISRHSSSDISRFSADGVHVACSWLRPVLGLDRRCYPSPNNDCSAAEAQWHSKGELGVRRGV
jgi:hypothetical protein